MIEELDRYPCIGDDGSKRTVIAYRYLHFVRGDTGASQREGARKLVADTGASVRPVDDSTFEVIESGELLRRAPRVNALT